MSEPTNFVGHIKGTKLVGSAVLIKISLLLVISHQTWFTDKGGPGYCLGSSPGPPLKLIDNKIDG